MDSKGFSGGSVRIAALCFGYIYCCGSEVAPSDRGETAVVINEMTDCK